MLPIGTEPLVLADGTKISPIDGTIVTDDIMVEVPNTEQLKREIVASRKKLTDLPLPPVQMNTLSVILSYTLQGISDYDICVVININETQLDNIKSSEAYKQLQDTIVKSIMESDLADVRSMFVDKSRVAAQKVFSLMDSESESMRMAASKDVLDRAGQRPADIIEHRHRIDGGLTIEYVEKKDNVPIIDITPNGDF
jgi:hypothetical protein